MKISPVITSIMLILLSIVLQGCVEEFKMISPPTQAPLMRYTLEKDQFVTYSIKSELLEELKVQRKKVENIITKNIFISYTLQDTKNDRYQLEGKLQFVDIRYKNTYIGEEYADTKDLQRKIFHISMDTFGEEGPLIGEDELSYSVPRIGEQSLEYDFEDFFPELPGYPLEIGQSWTQTDTLYLGDYGENSLLIEEKEHTLSGYAMVNERGCAVIKTFFTTTMTLSNWSESVEWITDVEYQGEDTWFFDYKNGVLVKLIQKAKGGGESIAQDITGQVIPIKRTFSMEVTLKD